MTTLIAAAAFFAGIHLLISGTRLRDGLVARLGPKAYTAGFSLASALGLAALIYSYGEARVPQVTALLGLRPLASTLMLVAIILIVLGIGSRGPTAVGGESKLDRADAVRGIHRITRHPMLWGIMLWALTHMLFNPQSEHLVFFGAFLLTAAVGTVSIDAKRRRKLGEPWARYEQQTSNLPFLAIAQGRNRLVLSEISLPLFIAASLIHLALQLAHARLFGLPAF